MSVSDFENILKDVVNAKRLSASKMTQLTEIAMKSMENDTKLVSILYRTHKSLPNTSAKISSLYVFDALSRAAKHHATKHNVSGDAFTSPGNAATFLLKVGGVVEGLFQDLVAVGTPESKEKTKKILDIWTKGNTFPVTILVPLAEILNGNQKASDIAVPIVPMADSQSLPSVDPRMPQITYTPPVSVPVTPSIPVTDQHATLLALLTQAATITPNVPTHSSINTTVSAPPPLDAVQLAVIQQLAHTAASVPSVPQFLPPADLVNVQKFPSSSGVNGSSHSLPSFRNEPRKMVNSEQTHIGYRSPETEPRTDSHFDERDNTRGRYRPGFRNRGRGEKSGRNWDPRDRDHYRTGRDQSPSQSRTGRGGRSRSRSPGPSSRYNARKESRYSSPPPRPTIVSPSARRDNELGKDEFGRDIRPESPKTPATADHRPPSPLPLISNTTSEQSRDLQISYPASSHHDSTHNAISAPSVSLSANAPPTKQSGVSLAIGTKELGMESFNPAAFDFTSPTQWEALGKMWEVTNGYLPSTEELMQFMMSAATGQAAPNLRVSAQESHSHGPSTGRAFSRGRGRGGFSGGGNVYGNDRGGHSDGGAHTDAIVLQETSNVEAGSGLPNGAHTWNQKNEPEEYNTNAGGRMQRVGDKWVFVRGTTMDVS